MWGTISCRGYLLYNIPQSRDNFSVQYGVAEIWECNDALIKITQMGYEQDKYNDTPSGRGVLRQNIY